MTDQELVHLILMDGQSKEGRLAASRLYRRYYWKIERFVSRKRSSITRMMEYRDVVVVSLGRVFLNLHKFDVSQCAFSTWVFSIAKNALFDQNRQSIASKNQFLSFDSEFAHFGLTQDIHNRVNTGRLIADSIRDGYTPEMDILREERTKAIRIAFDKLKPREAMVLRMFYLDRLKYEQIAKETGICLNTVKILIFRAKKSFKVVVDDMNSKMKAPAICI
jgi:RNA polymerase sigma factor (sigma-70 family)